MEDERDSGFEFSYQERYPDRPSPNYDSHGGTQQAKPFEKEHATSRPHRSGPADDRTRSDWRGYARWIRLLFSLISLGLLLYVVYLISQGAIPFEPIHWYNVLVDTISTWIIGYLKDLFANWPV